MSKDATEKLKSEISDLAKKLKYERDELNLQMHLAKAEARDEWDALEKQWNHFQGKVALVTGAAHDASAEIGTATCLLGEEIKNGYKHIREAFKSEA